MIEFYYCYTFLFSTKTIFHNQKNTIVRNCLHIKNNSYFSAVTVEYTPKAIDQRDHVTKFLKKFM